MKKSNFKYLIPVLITILFLVFFSQLLSRDVTKLSSQLIERPVPDFSMPTLFDENNILSSIDITSSEVALVNIWASWCVPCRSEHEILMLLSKTKGLDLYGINYKDDKKNAIKFIEKLGNPFKKIGTDDNGRSSMVWGVYGVPETIPQEERDEARNQLNQQSGFSDYAALISELAMRAEISRNEEIISSSSLFD